MVDTTFAMGMDFFAGPERWGSRSLMISPFRAVHGTPSLPESCLEAAARSTVPLMTGTATNEATGFLELLGFLGGAPAGAADAMLGLLGADEEVQSAYRGAPRGATSDVAILEAAWTDWAFRIPTFRLLERRTAPSYLYQFAWESAAYPPGLGSNHAFDVPFMRDDLESLRATNPLGAAILDGAPEELAHRMHADWARFAKTGDPGWPQFDPARRTTMIYDHVSGQQDDPAKAERLAWEGKR
jgi:para-nitrobenzyl esterase